MVKSSVWLATCGVALALFHSAAAVASPAKRPLTYADSASFREILSPTLSRDGQWLATVEMPQEGDGRVVIHQLATDRRWSLAVGATPPPPFPQPTSPNERRPAPERPTIAFTSDNQFLITHTLPSHADQVADRIDKSKDKAGRNLLITRLSDGTSETVTGVKSLQVPARGGSVIAYALAPSPAEKKAESGERTPAPDDKGDKAAPPAGDTLVVRDLATGHQREVARVTAYALARDGHALVYATAAAGPTAAALQVIDPARDDAAVVIYTGAETISKLTWDQAQTQLAFLCENKPAATPVTRSVRVWTRGTDTSRVAVDAKTEGVPAGMIVSGKAALAFTPDGKKLLLSVAPPAGKFTPPADPEDRVDLDLWSWNDNQIQSRQAVLAGVDRDRAYRGVIDLPSGRYTQIGTRATPDVLISDDATRALAIDYGPYYRLRDYDGTYGDIYLLNLANGERRCVLKKLRGGTGDEGAVTLQFSPDGHWAGYYADKQWHVLDLNTGENHSLTDRLPVAFYDELHDQPEPARAVGLAGWAADSQSVLLYDRYDLWQVFPDGRPARNLTLGYGRAHRMILRRQDVAAHEEDDPARGVDLKGPLIVRGEDEHTRATGFLRFEAGHPAPQTLLWGDCCYYYIGRALQADRLMLTASRFDEFPDVWVTDEALDAPRRVTDGQAQLAPFKWGHAEMIDYKNSAGVPLQACLYLPADFNPAKKYPLIVYTYERLSEIIHRFFPPVPGSNISFPIYASNGYIVMLADIAYTEGHPGDSAVDCISAALDAVEARGFVDEKAIGYQGSSWGGYTAAYLLTHSNRFAAIAGGAIVSNMTSAYGGIRLYSGQPRLFQYEQSQSRIGRSLADAPELYFENSPLFAVKNASAPFLILHNDRDGAVPFEQAVEFYLSLRRHDKPVWLFNYHNEGHGVSRLANRKDYSRRMWQFFDHFLRGAPAPDWLKNGIPYLERDEEKATYDHYPAAAPKS